MNCRPAHRYDDAGNLRIVVGSISTFAGATDDAFNQIRLYARDSVPVLACLLETIGEIALQARRDDQRHALRIHLEMIHRQARRTVKEELDRQRIDEAYHAAMERVSRS